MQLDQTIRNSMIDLETVNEEIDADSSRSSGMDRGPVRLEPVIVTRWKENGKVYDASTELRWADSFALPRKRVLKK